jgi:hypothetical protein
MVGLDIGKGILHILKQAYRQVKKSRYIDMWSL